MRASCAESAKQSEPLKQLLVNFTIRRKCVSTLILQCAFKNVDVKAVFNVLREYFSITLPQCLGEYILIYILYIYIICLYILCVECFNLNVIGVCTGRGPVGQKQA